MGLEPEQSSQKKEKKSSLSVAIREMKIKATLKFYLIPIRMAKINQTANNKCWCGCGDRRTISQAHFWGIVGWYNHYENQYGEFSKSRCKSTI